jgi:hypothetical protein
MLFEKTNFIHTCLGQNQMHSRHSTESESVACAMAVLATVPEIAVMIEGENDTAYLQSAVNGCFRLPLSIRLFSLLSREILVAIL